MVDKIEKAINKKTVGIVIPNLIGFLPDWKKINKNCKKIQTHNYRRLS